MTDDGKCKVENGWDLRVSAIRRKYDSIGFPQI